MPQVTTGARDFTGVVGPHNGGWAIAAGFRLHPPVPRGQAVTATAGRLPGRQVSHTVRPVRGGGAADEPDLLASCEHGSPALGGGLGARSTDLPAISKGIGGFPCGMAAATVRRVVRGHPQDPPEPVRPVLPAGEDRGWARAHRGVAERQRHHRAGPAGCSS